MTPTRRTNLIFGALVADAAAMGLHWIYDQSHIRKIAPDAPEFRAPDPKNYADVPAYLAHAGRAIGQQSQYGEQAMVMLRALTKTGGQYDAHTYAAEFRAHFGYGGSFAGYIDHATRDTLDNFRRVEDAALARAQLLPFEGDKKVTTAMVGKAMAVMKQHEGAVLSTRFEEAVRMTHDDDSVVAHGFAVLKELQAMPMAQGAQDEQLPAIAKLPPLIAALAGGDQDLQAAVDSAVRVTNDHPRARDFGRVGAAMMQAAVHAETVEDIAAAGRAVATPECDALLADAVSRVDQDNDAVTRHFGMACDLNYGVPSALHNILTASSFTEAVRRNIYAGGDSCGRAMLVGSVLGAMYGVGGDLGIPEAWIAKLAHRAELDATIPGILD